MSDELAHRITQELYDGKDRLATIVPAAESLDPEKGREVVPPVRAAPGRRALLRGAGAVKLLLAVALGALAVAGGRSPHVVARDAAGEKVADLRLPAVGHVRARVPALVLPRSPRARRSARATTARSSWWRSARRARPCSTTTRSRARARGATVAGRCGPARPARFERHGARGDRGRPADAGGRRRAGAAVRRRRPPAAGGGAMTAPAARAARPADRGAAARGVRGRAPGPAADRASPPRSSTCWAPGCRCSPSTGCSTRSPPSSTGRRSSRSSCC